MIDLRLGDCLELFPSISDSSVDLIVTSPPYNCRKDYGVFDDQMAWGEYYAWMNKVLGECYRVLRAGGTLALNVPMVIKWQREHKFSHTWSDFDPTYKNHRGNEKWTGKGRIEPVGIRLFEMMRAFDSHVREPIVWVKGSEGNAITSGYQMGCDSDPYIRSAHEHIWLGSKGRWFHRGGTGRRGKEAIPDWDSCKDVWFISPDRSNHHPAPFPKEIPARLIRLFVHAKDAVVCDPFMGKGTTALAAIEADVSFVGFELNRPFYDYAQERIQTQLALPMVTA